MSYLRYDSKHIDTKIIDLLVLLAEECGSNNPKIKELVDGIKEDSLIYDKDGKRKKIRGE